MRQSLKNLTRRLLGRTSVEGDMLQALPEAEFVSSSAANRGVTLGVITEFTNAHVRFVAACRELGVPYKLVDIAGPNWIEDLRESSCDAYLVRPSYSRSAWKQMFDERLRIMVRELGLIVYPGIEEVWLYESKRRMAYWLQVNGFPHPKTWIFYGESAARQFVEKADLPIVSKNNFGAGSSGVQILTSRGKARGAVRRAFGRGTVRRGGDRQDREWGSIVFQEYVSDPREWRMVRIGDSYFGHLKLRRGTFHSGSGLAGWEDPPHKLLDLTRSVTDRGEFSSMALDIFETQDGRYLINELQTVFGFRASRQSQMLVDGKPGRYRYDGQHERWVFEPGDFSSNGGYKLRVQTLLEMLRATEQKTRNAPTGEA